MLNAGENWITRGVRAEFSGSYVMKRAGQELYGAMKMIAGSVYMIKANVLRELGWGTSITEDWELTLRLYIKGYKVMYTPYIQAPAECVSTFRRLVRQRMRWAEGHTFNVKRFFFPVLRSQHLTATEKLEFLYYAPYYLQSVLFTLGTTGWLVSELLLHERLPYWSAMFGWSLLFSNMISLPLLNLAGLFLEGSIKRDSGGLFSFIALSYLLVPFQAYASLKGLFEREEGTWHRTLKSGRVTETLERFHLGKRFDWLLPHPVRRRLGALPLLGGMVSS
ncbi:MAG: glycosyltransferase family 2 protein, partial [Chloroflexi bacterium]|nr:glycosyltransferase family 2 protein [Chloroflexota bacterium]